MLLKWEDLMLLFKENWLNIFVLRLLQAFLTDFKYLVDETISWSNEKIIGRLIANEINH